jgi:NADPH-dependent glutamate synthase beta subunit-like oxidoreductase
VLYARTRVCQECYAGHVCGGQFYQTISASRRFTGKQDEYEDSDVVIVGGGPAGLALASALGEYSIHIHKFSSDLQVLKGHHRSFKRA